MLRGVGHYFVVYLFSAGLTWSVSLTMISTSKLYALLSNPVKFQIPPHPPPHSYCSISVELDILVTLAVMKWFLVQLICFCLGTHVNSYLKGLWASR